MHYVSYLDIKRHQTFAEHLSFRLKIIVTHSGGSDMAIPRKLLLQNCCLLFLIIKSGCSAVLELWMFLQNFNESLR